MVRSKRIKDSYWKSSKQSDNKYVKALIIAKDAFLSRTYRPVENFIRWNWKRIRRAFDYAVFSWSNWDFDSKCVYDLMAWKYRRLYKTMKHGHVVQTAENMASLKEAIDICQRLADERYGDKYYKIHNKKWGPLKMRLKPMDDKDGKKKGYSTSIFSRKNAKTEKQKTQESKELRKVYDLAEEDRVKDLKRLCELLIDDESSWWE
jgi:hypothetical protein